MEKPETKEQAMERMKKAYDEWQNDILPKRIEKIKRFQDIRTLRRDIIIKQPHVPVRKLIDLENEQKRIVDELQPEEDAWKKKYNVEVEKNSISMLYSIVGFNRFLIDGWVGPAIKYVDYKSKKPDEKREMEIIKNDKYI